MKKYRLLILLPLLVGALSGCDDNHNEGYQYVTPEPVVNFMLNYRKDQATLPSGYVATGDDLLYHQNKIDIGQLVIAPENPQREGYSFNGWYKEKACLEEWNFDVDLAMGNLFLYAGWNVEQEGTYVEPEYIPVEKINDAMSESFVFESVCNIPISSGIVNLTKAAILRLENSADDCLDNLGYVRKTATEIISATYSIETNIVIIITSYQSVTSEHSALVVDVTSTYAVSSNYESKAQKYEVKEGEELNHRVLLGGSSSMENWDTSIQDLAPIISYNHGIGGTTVQHWRDALARRLIYPYSPKAVVLYVGINNVINSKETGQVTGNLLVELFDDIHEHLPNTQVYYVLMNKLPGFMQYTEEIITGNNIVINYANQGSNSEWLIPIDAGTILLKPNGNPNVAYFLSDGLHMSRYGYVLWGGVIKRTLMDNL
ncbi:MAG: InlB B-repeat-containing protein [Bacilli bacterium]|jgi:uncharacterized repeat protein (TIGR02543 family)